MNFPYIINHPFWGTIIFGNTQVPEKSYLQDDPFGMAFFDGLFKVFGRIKREKQLLNDSTLNWKQNVAAECMFFFAF